MRFFFLLSIITTMGFFVACNFSNREPPRHISNNKRARVAIGFRNGTKDTMTIEYCNNLLLDFHCLEDDCEHITATDVQYFSLIDSSINIK